MDLQIPPSFYTSDAIASAALLLALILAWLIAGRALRRRNNLPEHVVRRWTANVRNVLVLIAVVGLTMIWAPQLQTFALSLTAVAVAIVVATKELILCLSGAALRTFTRAFAVGDIVEIGTSKGEVLDINLLATRLREFDERSGSISPTGRTIILPYSLLFSSPARVLPHSSEKLPHTFQMTFEPDVDIFKMRAELEKLAAQTLAQEGDSSEIAQGAGARQPGCQIDFGTSDVGKYRLEITVSRYSQPPKEVENAVACAIGSFVHSHRTPM